jgi:glycosyltransferase involved in cell wall biosynthesis
VCYWSLGEGLTQATVLPHLSILLSSENIEKLVFVTIERGIPPIVDDAILQHPKLTYQPLETKNYPINLINKINDFVVFPTKLKSIVESYKIDKVIARGTPAAALIYKICVQKSIPYYVESMEPHADYMLESGVWKQWDPRYLYQKKWEKIIKQTAAGLMPVAENYKKRLLSEGIPTGKIITAPCIVDLQKFAFNASEREQIRSSLRLAENTITGIYVGKFGGIYYKDEAFILFKKLICAQPTLHLIILSPDSHSDIYHQIIKYSLPKNQFTVLSVKHTEVPSFLSAADFALATIKPSKSRIFCSAIKVGEYWAQGLPIMITPNVGDDSAIISENKIGVVLDPNWQSMPDAYFKKSLQELMKADRDKIRTIAQKYRSIRRSKIAYKYFQLV